MFFTFTRAVFFRTYMDFYTWPIYKENEPFPWILLDDEWTEMVQMWSEYIEVYPNEPHLKWFLVGDLPPKFHTPNNKPAMNKGRAPSCLGDLLGMTCPTQLHEEYFINHGIRIPEP